MPIAQRIYDDDYVTEEPPQRTSAAKAPKEKLASSSPPGGDAEHDHDLPSSQQVLDTPTHRTSGRVSPSETRQELIERIKRGRRAVSSQEEEDRSSYISSNTVVIHGRADVKTAVLSSSDVVSNSSESLSVEDPSERTKLASGIERPRSALHRGDFRENTLEHQSIKSQADGPRPRPDRRDDVWLSTSPTTPWYTPRHAPPRLPQYETFAGFSNALDSKVAPLRARAASHSLQPSSFVFRPPTSPLVNEERNSDSEMSDFGVRKRSKSPDKASRRRTFSPGYLQTIRQSSFGTDSLVVPGLALPNVRREGTFPYQAHQPRRSLNSSTDTLPYSLPQSPSARSRRPSQASETSPLQRAPMVGRYEESILRGRMSSLPSRPLDFVARIGVLGKGNCRPSLRCPPHIAVPFPAVFYHYGSRPGSPSTAADQPSPYVGMVDLETPREPAEVPNTFRPAPAATSLETPTGDSSYPPSINVRGKIPPRWKHKNEGHNSPRPRFTPCGGYRIPQQGQLQIILKNPNKTAVKLFLVPYDLTSMEPGQRTFIRQRSYSAGPIIDMPIEARRNLGTDRPEAALTNSDDPQDRPVLRYLIHLNICCPSRGRFYLYKSIRVVFANRVPDGKEKLRLEIQMPEPCFSRYRPEHDRSSPKGDTCVANMQAHRSDFEDDVTSRPDQHSPSHDRDMDVAMLSPKMDSLRSRTFQSSCKPLPVIVPPFASRSRSDADPDVHMHSLDSPCSMRIVKSTNPDFETNGPARLEEFPTFRPRSRHTFERLARDEYNKDDSERDRTRSPKPGEGLLALQLRDRAVHSQASRRE